MTARVLRPTDDHAPGGPRGPGGASGHSLFEGDKTREGMGFAGVVQAAAEPAAPVDAAARERSEPIRVFSMKEQTAQRQTNEHRAPLHIQLRSLAEVAGRRHDTPPAGLGRFAPPRDPAQARTWHWRANAVWACVVVALAAAIALAIWLVAGR